MTGIRRVSQLGTTGESTFVDGSIQAVDIAANAVTQDKLAADIPLSGFRNAIINGGFDIWQRGVGPLTLTTGAQTFLADRWSAEYDGSGATRILSQVAFTPGTAPTSGYEATYFHRWNQSVAGTSGTYNLLQQRIEDIRTFAGQPVTVSFWAKASSAITLPSLTWQQYTGTTGPSTNFALNIAITTSWTRYTYTTTVPSISGLTIGASSFLGLRFFLPLNSTFTFDLWGVQVEKSTVATPFEQRPIGTELALCQRYYEDSVTVNGQAGAYAAGLGGNTYCSGTYFKVTKRIAPSSTNGASDTSGNIRLWDNTGVAGRASLYRAGWATTTTATTDWAGTWGFNLTTTGSTTDAAMVAFRWAFSAEL